jgi:hypothetical protein
MSKPAWKWLFLNSAKLPAKTKGISMGGMIESFDDWVAWAFVAKSHIPSHSILRGERIFSKIIKEE